jgi:uncharacterized protein (TIGR02147 family)
MSLFETNDYKVYVHKRLKDSGKRGGFQEIAAELAVHPSMVSQIFRGKKHLTGEQASQVAKYLGLAPNETSYFTLLVLRDRARTEELRRVFEEQLERIREVERPTDAPPALDGNRLSDRDKAVFYSNWCFSGVRLSTYVPELKNIDAIAAYLGLQKDLVRQIVDFLLSTGLVREREGCLELGPKNTRLEASSPFLAQHHSNWRMRSLERMRSIRPHELYFTCPMAIGQKDSIRIRELLLGAIDSADAILEKSGAEKVACLNIDWFDAI